jgi:hypothetical protein
MVKYKAMAETYGNGCIKILIICDPECSIGIEKQIADCVSNCQNLTVTIVLSNIGVDDIKRIVSSQKSSDRFVLAINISTKHKELISGFGDRFLGILEKSEISTDGVKEAKSEFSEWFLTNYHFSTIQINYCLQNFDQILNKILNYMNGKKNVN